MSHISKDGIKRQDKEHCILQIITKWMEIKFVYAIPSRDIRLEILKNNIFRTTNQNSKLIQEIFESRIFSF